MTLFNSFYYSFSPSVATTISNNEPMRQVMKVILYPLIGILGGSYEVYKLLSFSPELGVVSAGLVASALMAAVYIVPLVLLFSFLKRFRPSIKIVRLIGLVWIGSAVVMFVAEIVASSLLMMTSSGVFVIASMCLTTLFSTRILARAFD